MVAGLILTLFFKIIQSITEYKVYTLLLNIDYIPFLNRILLPEIVEVALHLIVSIALSIVIFFIILTQQIKSASRIFFFCICTSFIIGACYFPTTLLSDRTPSINSIPSLAYWLLGHVLYGFTLGILLQSKHLTR